LKLLRYKSESDVDKSLVVYVSGEAAMEMLLTYSRVILNL